MPSDVSGARMRGEGSHVLRSTRGKSWGGGESPTSCSVSGASIGQQGTRRGDLSCLVLYQGQEQGKGGKRRGMSYAVCCIRGKSSGVNLSCLVLCQGQAQGVRAGGRPEGSGGGGNGGPDGSGGEQWGT